MSILAFRPSKKPSALLITMIVLTASGLVQGVPGAPLVQQLVPASFGKTSPANGATGLATSVTLTWATSSVTAAPPAAVFGRDSDSRPEFAVPPLIREMVEAEHVNYFTRVGVFHGAMLQTGVASATFNVTYNGFSPQAQAAFQYAVNIWSTLISSPVPIAVTANWTPLGGSTLGSAGATFVFRNFSGAPQSDVWYTVALANRMSGTDLAPSDGDLVANFNSTYSNWYYGTDGNTPAGQFDLVSVVLHELAHGLGFFGSASVSGSNGSLGFSGFPTVYDLSVVNGAGQSILSFPNPSPQLGAELQSNNLFWDGINGKAANGGVRPKLYIPAGWSPGSSYSHLDDATYPAGNANSLMTHAIGQAEAIHSPGPITTGMFQDWGWSIADPVSHEYCYDTINNNACDGSWISVGASNSANIGGLSAATTYYWQVRARNSSGTTEADGGAWWSFSTQPQARPLGDFDGNGQADLAVYRPTNGTWYVRNQFSIPFGVANDIPAFGDYNGDHITDVAVFRPSGGVWYVRNQFTVQFGAPGDIPVPGDYNGDGVTDVAVFRPSNGVWYVRNQFSVQFGAAGDVPVPGDYNGDGQTDVAVWRPASGTWYVRNQFTLQWGAPGDVPVPARYDSDATTDIAVWRPSVGAWYVRNQFTRILGGPGDLPVVLDVDGDGRAELGAFQRSTGIWLQYNVVTTASTAVQHGAPGDIPLGILPVWRALARADLEGDGRSDLTVYRSPGIWSTALSGGGTVQHSWGTSGDVPAAADYDGDRRMDLAVYRPSTGTWHVTWSSTSFGASQLISWGAATDIPVPADYDGDGAADIAVYTPSSGIWSIRLSSGGTGSIQWGAPGDVPIAGDYDGDGIADPAVYRPSVGGWFMRLSSTNYATTQAWQWGTSGDQPVVGDFDGDGRVDLTVFRPSSGLWYVAFSSTNFASVEVVQWGANGDTPVALDYNGDGLADIAVYRSPGIWYVYGQFTASWGAPADIPTGKTNQ